jgi:hypothetical protein
MAMVHGKCLVEDGKDTKLWSDNMNRKIILIDGSI